MRYRVYESVVLPGLFRPEWSEAWFPLEHTWNSFLEWGTSGTSVTFNSLEGAKQFISNHLAEIEENKRRNLKNQPVIHNFP